VKVHDLLENVALGDIDDELVDYMWRRGDHLNNVFYELRRHKLNRREVLVFLRDVIKRFTSPTKRFNLRLYAMVVAAHHELGSSGPTEEDLNTFKQQLLPKVDEAVKTPNWKVRVDHVVDNGNHAHTTVLELLYAINAWRKRPDFNKEWATKQLMKYTLNWLKSMHEVEPRLSQSIGFPDKWATASLNKLLGKLTQLGVPATQVDGIRKSFNSLGKLKSTKINEIIGTATADAAIERDLNAELGHFVYNGGAHPPTSEIIEIINRNQLPKSFVMRWLLKAVQHYAGANSTVRGRLRNLAYTIVYHTNVGPTRDEFETIAKSLSAVGESAGDGAISLEKLLNAELGHILHSQKGKASDALIDIISQSGMDRQAVMRWFLGHVKSQGGRFNLVDERLFGLAGDLRNLTRVGPNKEELNAIEKSLLKRGVSEANEEQYTASDLEDELDSYLFDDKDTYLSTHIKYSQLSREEVMHALLNSVKKVHQLGGRNEFRYVSGRLSGLCSFLARELKDKGPTAAEISAIKRSLDNVNKFVNEENVNWEGHLSLQLKIPHKSSNDFQRTAYMVHVAEADHPELDLVNKFKDELMKFTLSWHRYIASNEHLIDIAPNALPAHYYREWLNFLDQRGWPEVKHLKASFADLARQFTPKED